MKYYPKLDSDSFGACGACGATWYIFCDNSEVVLYCFIATFILKRERWYSYMHFIHFLL